MSDDDVSDQEMSSSKRVDKKTKGRGFKGSQSDRGDRAVSLSLVVIPYALDDILTVALAWLTLMVPHVAVAAVRVPTSPLRRTTPPLRTPPHRSP
jgi:hypothetical protein